MSIPYSRNSATLTASYVPLTTEATFGIQLMNNTGAAITYKLNGGAAVTLASGAKDYIPEVSNANMVSVSSASGKLDYLVFLQA